MLTVFGRKHRKPSAKKEVGGDRQKDVAEGFEQVARVMLAIQR